jgi:hypothetical protein
MGVIELKNSDKKKCAQNMGILHEKNWAKKAPPSLLHEARWGGEFFNISVNQIGHFEEGQKIKSK